MVKVPFLKMKIILLIILALIVLPFAGAAETVSVWSSPCCPNIFPNHFYPVYDYYGNQIWPPEGEYFDPYYSFPAYCSCPFLDDALNRPYPYYYYNFPDIIITRPTSTSLKSSSCSTCSGVSQGSFTESITYISETTNFPDQSQMIAAITKSTGYTPHPPSVF